MNRICGIYKITSPTGAVYVGQSRDIKNRWTWYKHGHKFVKNSRIINSIKKYGISSHVFSVAHHLPVDIDDNTLTFYEQLYIDQHKGCGIVVLNIAAAGVKRPVSQATREKMTLSKKGRPAWNKGIPHSAETIEKMKKSKIGFVITEENALKISLSLKGKPKSEEHKMKLREANLGKKASDETRKKMSQSTTGKKKKPLSAETKEKLSNANRGRIKSPETLKKMSEALKGRTSSMKGRTHSDETKKKLSEISKSIPRTPESNAKRSAAMKGRYLGRRASEETRAKISAAQLGRKMSPEAIAKRVSSFKANRK